MSEPPAPRQPPPSADGASAMERLRRIRGVSWEWDDPSHPSYRPGRQMGVIAQELREVFPDLVREGDDGFLTVDYAGLLAPVIEALKELDARLYRDAKSRDGQTLVIVYRHKGRQRKETMRGPWRTSIKAARARQNEILGDVVTGAHRPRSQLTFSGYVEEWAQTYKGRTGRGIRAHTLADYKRDLELHADPVLGRLRISEIEPPDLRALVTRLEKKGKSPNTVRNVVAAVRVVLASAHADGIIRHNPAAGLRLAGATRGKVKWLEPDELQRLFRETPEEWKPFVRLLAFTGCRISEFLALTWDDLDIEAATLVVNKRVYQGKIDAPKSPYGVRTIPLTREIARELVQRRLASPSSADGHPIFASERGTHLQPSNVSRRIFKPAAKRAGVEWASFHTLRHTCGTMLARKGLRPEEIQAWLGHHAASFTQDTYIGRPSRPPDVEGLGLDVLDEVTANATVRTDAS